MQENSIKSPLQSNLPYILLPMVHARYCAFYPKQLCVKHVANIWYPYCMMSLCSRTFYFFLSYPVINVVTPPSDVMMWLITSNPNPRVLKIEKCKIIKRKRKWEIKKKNTIKSIISYLYISVPKFFNDN